MSRSAAHALRTNDKKLLLDLLPDPGAWSETDYLWLTDHTTRRVELSDGFLELLPRATYIRAMIQLGTR